ncbi:MAG: FtsW/RodA/SpoVE family cell cycle protein [Clostridia bacterium]|nr:FtsW/RodA/SpoVE family cell cycle protein [Clostridia bacterium]
MPISKKRNPSRMPPAVCSLTLWVAILSFIGILIIRVSSQFEFAPVSFANHILHIIIGAAIMTGLFFFDCTRLQKHPFAVLSAGLLLVIYCAVFGQSAGGVRQWISVAGFSISVNHIASVLYIASFCALLEKCRNTGSKGILALLLAGLICGASLALLPSASFILLLWITYTVLLVRAIYTHHFGGNSKKQMIVVLSFCAAAVLLTSWFIARHPFHQASGVILQASRPFGTAMPLAQGSIDQLIPEIAADFSLLNIIAHWGWIAGAALIAIILKFIVQMWVTALRIRCPFGMTLALGSCIMLAAQFLLSLLINLGLFPYIDISLPFVSYGGTGYLASMIYTGFMLSALRSNAASAKNSCK